jgi:FKBP-type peptidyl-prolyl cis-trans isomerase 2
LIGKKPGESFSLDLKPKEAFGERDRKLLRTIPIKVFLEQKINPYPGLVLNMDGMIVRIAAVSGGRVTADFNNPLAGKELVYELHIKKKIESLEEKAKALINFFLRKDFKFEIKDNKLIIEAIEPEQKYISIFKDKFEEILNLDMDFKLPEKKEKQEENSQES